MTLTAEQLQQLRTSDAERPIGLTELKEPQGHWCLKTQEASGQTRTFVYDSKPFAGGTVGELFNAQDIHSGKEYVLKAQHLTIDALIERTRLKQLKQSAGFFYHDTKLEELIARQDSPAIKEFVLSKKELRTDDPKEKFWIVMEKIPGKTLKEIKSEVDKSSADPKTREPITLDMLYKTACATQEVHKNGVYHCDINPDNTMYDEGLQKSGLIDFSTAVAFKPPATEVRGDPRGSPAFVDRRIREEMFKGQRSEDVTFNEATEVHALGLTLAFSAGLTVPQRMAFKDEHNLPTTLEIISDDTPPYGKMLAADSPLKKPLLKLVREMTDEDPAKRPTLSAVTTQLAKLSYAALPQHEKSLVEGLVMVQALDTFITAVKDKIPATISPKPGLLAHSPIQLALKEAEKMRDEINKLMQMLTSKTIDKMEFAEELKKLMGQFKSSTLEALAKITNQFQKNPDLRSKLLNCMKAIQNPDKEIRDKPDLMELAFQNKVEDKIKELSAQPVMGKALG